MPWADDAFADAFWPLYPRKVAREAARLAFLKAVGKEENHTLLKAILHGIRWHQASEWKDRPLDKVPHAATWLNQKRWLDCAVGDADDQEILDFNEAVNNIVGDCIANSGARAVEEIKQTPVVKDETRSSLYQQFLDNAKGWDAELRADKESR